MAVFVEAEPRGPAGWAEKLGTLPSNADLLRVFACEPDGRVVFDSAKGRDVGQVYRWPMTGGGRVASENYTLANVAQVNDGLRVVAPVRRNGEHLGWIGVARPL